MAMLDDGPYSRTTANYAYLSGKRLLIVEDDAVVAVDYHFQLRAVGAEAQGYKPTNKAGLDYLATHDIDAAIVDYCLRDGPCYPLLRLLQRRGIPFLVVSGCTFEMHGSVESSQV